MFDLDLFKVGAASYSVGPAYLHRDRAAKLKQEWSQPVKQPSSRLVFVSSWPH